MRIIYNQIKKTQNWIKHNCHLRIFNFKIILNFINIKLIKNIEKQFFMGLIIFVLILLFI